MSTIFKDGVVPLESQMPSEHTHARAKLIYRILSAVISLKKDKRSAALAEIKAVNAVLYDRVMHYLSNLTEAEIRFFKGDRPWYYADGKLAIYDPIKDNPVLMAVYKGETPTDGRKVVVVPG